METKIINTQEEWEALRDDGREQYYFNGHLKINIDVSCKAGYSIKAGGSIEAGYSIKAGGYIEAGDSIKAGYSVKAGGYIKAGYSIEAGGYIFSFVFFVSAKKIITRILPFWRQYWAEMPPLKQWKTEILNESRCWGDLQQLIKPHSKEICAWEGWHWILRAQLEMFFELKSEFIPPGAGPN